MTLSFFLSPHFQELEHLGFFFFSDLIRWAESCQITKSVRLGGSVDVYMFELHRHHEKYIHKKQ